MPTRRSAFSSPADARTAQAGADSHHYEVRPSQERFDLPYAKVLASLVWEFPPVSLTSSILLAVLDNLLKSGQRVEAVMLVNDTFDEIARMSKRGHHSPLGGRAFLLIHGQ